MNKDELQRKSKSELEEIAQKLGLSQTSNLNKGQLSDWIIIKSKNLRKLSAYKTISLFVAISIFIVGYLNYTLNKKSKINICEKNNIENFDNPELFNLIITDILDFGSCSSYEECEVYLLDQINTVNGISTIQIDAQILNCSKQDLNLYTDEEVQKLLNDVNGDMIVFGNIEKSMDSKVNLLINYDLNNNIKTKWYNYSGKDIVFSDSTFNGILKNNDFSEITDAINWSIVSKLFHNEKINDQFVRAHLGAISKSNKRNYSNAKTLEASTYLRRKDLDTADSLLKEAMRIDTLNPNVYYNSFLFNLIDCDMHKALDDIYLHYVLSTNKFHQDSSFVAREILASIDFPTAHSRLILEFHNFKFDERLREYVINFYDEFGYELLVELIGINKVNDIEKIIETDTNTR